MNPLRELLLRLREQVARAAPDVGDVCDHMDHGEGYDDPAWPDVGEGYGAAFDPPVLA